MSVIDTLQIISKPAQEPNNGNNLYSKERSESEETNIFYETIKETNL